MTGLDGVSEEFVEFWRQRLLATLSTARPDGSLHVVPVGVTIDPAAGVARVITSGDSYKARRIAAAGSLGVPATLCQVDGRRWSSLEGTAVVRGEVEVVADAVRRYAERYRQPRVNPRRVVIELAVSRLLGLR